MSFSDKVVIVTGASSGIGAATAVLFSKEGANVVMVGRNELKLANIANQCKKYKVPLVINADITKDDQAKAAIAKTIEKFKKINVLVNNAGIIRYGSILDGNLLQSYDEVMLTNLRALMHLTALAAPHLVKTKGSIVNISSVGGISVPKTPSSTAYYISKAAVNHFTRCSALELAPHGVRVNSISPGPVKTDLLGNAGIVDVAPVVDYLANLTAFKRVSDSNEIADLILYLCGDKAQAITGSDYVTDNGYMLLN